MLPRMRQLTAFTKDREWASGARNNMDISGLISGLKITSPAVGRQGGRVRIGRSNSECGDRISVARGRTAAAIDLIVQLSRMRDGSRKVTSISEITGMEGETITMQDIFVYEQRGVDAAGKVQGVFRPTGIRPNIVDKLFDMGIPIPGELARLFPDRRAHQR